MSNSKTLKIQRTFQNWSKILEFQKNSTTYKWGIMYNVLRKIVVCYTRRHKKFQNHFLVMIWNCYHFKKWNIEFTRNCHIFKKSYLFKNINWKTCHLPRKLYEHIIIIWGIFTIMVPLFHHKTPRFCFCYLPNTKSKWNKFKWEIFDN